MTILEKTRYRSHLVTNPFRKKCMYAGSEHNNVYQNIVLLPRRTGMQPNGMTPCACVKLWSK